MLSRRRRCIIASGLSIRFPCREFPKIPYEPCDLKWEISAKENWYQNSSRNATITLIYYNDVINFIINAGTWKIHNR